MSKFYVYDSPVKIRRMETVKVGSGAKVTTLNSERIPLYDADGTQLYIEKQDLANALLPLMSEAGINKGLARAGRYVEIEMLPGEVYNTNRKIGLLCCVTNYIYADIYICCVNLISGISIIKNNGSYSSVNDTEDKINRYKDTWGDIYSQKNTNITSL